jgi:tRNA dimethylallyltransferase
MDIGTAKPNSDQRAAVPHHLLDLIDPDQSFTLAQFQNLAYATIAAITARHRLPFLVGGSGLYVKCVIEGFRIPQMEPNPSLRQALQEEAARLGADALYAELQRVDPASARHILPGNVRRVIRALEVYRTLGVPISHLQGKAPPPYNIMVIGLTRSPQRLHALIAERVNAMLAAGLVNEVKQLVERGFGYDLPAMSGIGYREVGMYLRGELGLGDAREMIIRNTRRFVRRQYQWFRLNDPRITWFNLDEPDAQDRLEQFVLNAGVSAGNA